MSNQAYKEIFIQSMVKDASGLSLGCAAFVKRERAKDEIIVTTDGDFRIDQATLKVIADTLADDITPTN